MNREEALGKTSILASAGAAAGVGIATVITAPMLPFALIGAALVTGIAGVLTLVKK